MAQEAPFIFTLAMPGQAPLVRGLQRFASEVENWRPFWSDYFRDAWYRHVQVHYETQGRSTGEQWPPLSEAYGAWKQKHWPGIPIGVLSGATRESLTFQDDRYAVWNESDDALTVGTTVPYAMFLQLGTQGSGRSAGLRPFKGYSYGSGGGMPPRPPLRVNNEFALLTGRLLQEYAVDMLRRNLS